MFTISILLFPGAILHTFTFTGIFSSISARWEITPMLRPWLCIEPRPRGWTCRTHRPISATHRLHAPLWYHIASRENRCVHGFVRSRRMSVPSANRQYVLFSYTRSKTSAKLQKIKLEIKRSRKSLLTSADIYGIYYSDICSFFQMFSITLRLICRNRRVGGYSITKNRGYVKVFG